MWKTHEAGPANRIGLAKARMTSACQGIHCTCVAFDRLYVALVQNDTASRYQSW